MCVYFHISTLTDPGWVFPVDGVSVFVSSLLLLLGRPATVGILDVLE